jgi:hypothetical protein
LAPVSVLALDSVPPSDGASAGLPFSAPSFFLPSRKSVTYQPLPFKWKPAAVTCFEKAAAPHDGHRVNGASEIFSNRSFVYPQAAHL